MILFCFARYFAMRMPPSNNPFQYSLIGKEFQEKVLPFAKFLWYNASMFVEGVFHSRSPEETEALGEALAARLGTGSVVALFGGLGAGKTAFVRGLARGLGCAGEVCSPTYAIMNEYNGSPPLAHFDMYRVEGWEGLESTGWFDYLDGEHVVAVEWSENIAAAIPGYAWRVTISPGDGENSRLIAVDAPL